jgi:hypothetical protein
VKNDDKVLPMPKVLTEIQVKEFDQNGFLFPIDAYTTEEAAGLHSKFIAMEDHLGHEPQKKFRVKAHLPFPWLCDVVRNEKLLDAIEDILGPNILCWGASFFTKKANDPRFVSWHTDSFYYGLEPAETVTAWLAFNDATVESGCVQYIPGTHKGPPAVHEIRMHENNLVQQGQTVVDVPEDKAVFAEVNAGQVVLHHESVVHSSGPNNANHPRVGFSIHYVAPHVKETRFDGATAMLVRGDNVSDNWGIDPEPEHDYDPACITSMEDTRAKFTISTADKIAVGGRS